MRTKKELAVFLSHLKDFDTPDPRSEQYTTPSEIAAITLWDAMMAGDIAEKRILDPGAGIGILGIGALLLGASHVTFIEQDERALAILHENLRLAETVMPVMDRIRIIPNNLFMTDEEVDTIIMNSPFGTREEHTDQRFLEYALTHASRVYTFHKAATAEFIRKRISQLGATMLSERLFQWPLKQTMAHHTKRLEKIEVLLFVIIQEA